MPRWQIISRTDEFMTMMNEDGVTKKVYFASPAQMLYINNLRAELGKTPLKASPPMYKAKKMIDKLLLDVEKKKNS